MDVGDIKTRSRGHYESLLVVINRGGLEGMLQMYSLCM